MRAVDYLAAQRERRNLSLGTDAMMRCYDAVLLPCAMGTAPSFDDPDAVTGFTRNKVTTPFTVGTLRNPVVLSNLLIAAVHTVTVGLIWRAGV